MSETDNPVDDILAAIPEPEETGLEHISSEEAEDGPVVVAEEGYFVEGFSSSTMMDNKEFVRFVKACERIIRGSREYKQYIGWLKSDMKLNRCSIMGNVDEDMAALEMHHYPFTLYDICDIVTDYQIANTDGITTFSVADEVMRIHFECLVGIVPLTVTMHEMAHNGNLFIDIRQVFGNVEKFISTYENHIGEERMNKLERLIELSRENTNCVEGDLLSLSSKPDGEVSISNEFISSLEVITNDL